MNHYYIPKQLWILCIALLQLCCCAYCQITVICNTDSLVTYKAFFIDQASTGIKLIQGIDLGNGTYRFAFKKTASPFYFTLPALNRQQKYSSPLLFIAEDGDSVVIRNSPNHVECTGRGSEKYTAAWLLRKDGYSYQFNKKLFMQSAYEQMTERKRLCDSILQAKLALLNTYKDCLNKTVYELMRNDVEGQIAYSYLFSLYIRLKMDTVLTRREQYLRLCNEQLIQIEDSMHTTEPVHSAYSYAPVLLKLEMKDWIRQYSDGNRKPTANMYWILKKIREHYEGFLREKLITASVIKWFARQPESAPVIQSEMLQFNSFSLQEIIQHHLTAACKGKPAYAFTLENDKGKKISLSSFKNKVVVIDYWFTGCTSCMHLSRGLHPFIERYRRNDSIVFMSISADADKLRWLSSIASGNYTHKGAVNLYTNGMGFKHPLLHFYNYYSFPHLQVIDGNGNVVSAEAPQPLDESSRNRFQELIDEAFKTTFYSK